MEVLVGWVQILLTPPGTIRRNVPETACALSELLPPLLCLYLSMCIAFVQIHFLFVLLIKMVYFPHLKNVPYLPSSSDCQPCACRCGPVCADHRKMLERRKLRIWQCWKMLLKVGARNSRPCVLLSLMTHPWRPFRWRSQCCLQNVVRADIRWHPVLQGLPQEFVYEIKALSIRRTQSITTLQLLIKGGKRSPIDWLASVGLCLHWLKALNMSHPELCPDTASLRFNPLERFSFPDWSMIEEWGLNTHRLCSYNLNSC